MIFQSRPATRSTAPAQTRSLTKHELALVEQVASGETDAIGPLVDRWADSCYAFTDRLRMRGREADETIEEVFRRLIFEAPRFAARPEKLGEWISRTLKECSSAVVARRTYEEGLSSAHHSSPVAAAFSVLVSEGRLREAFAYLNSQTPFRFTAVYRVDGLSIANVFLYDRLTGFGTDRSSGAVSDTFCLWVQETMSVVQMSDSLADPRAAAHPRRDQVRSYCGGPIRAGDGRLIGTICHFDYQSHHETIETLPILAEVGPMLARVIAD